MGVDTQNQIQHQHQSARTQNPPSSQPTTSSSFSNAQNVYFQYHLQENADRHAQKQSHEAMAAPDATYGLGLYPFSTGVVNEIGQTYALENDTTVPNEAKIEQAEDIEGSEGKDEDDAGEDVEKKHFCPHCGKAFNRPSSLRIHQNTHTGEKRTSSLSFPLFYSPKRVRRHSGPFLLPSRLRERRDLRGRSIRLFFVSRRVGEKANP